MEGSASARSDPARQPSPSSCAVSPSAASIAVETGMRLSRIRFSAEWFCERGLLTALRMELRQQAGLHTNDSGNRELAFLGDPFESFGRAFDAILAVVAIGRQQPDDLIGAAGGRTGNIAGSKIDSLSNGVLMLQRPLHYARTPAALTVPLAFGRLENPAAT